MYVSNNILLGVSLAISSVVAITFKDSFGFSFGQFVMAFATNLLFLPAIRDYFAGLEFESVGMRTKATASKIERFVFFLLTLGIYFLIIVGIFLGAVLE
ncbi:hypothetical protein SAMN02745664_101307 [Moraxella cuniculi DSM 21768]|uniref:Uncharacterized protein n=1 Tax=Moraxella cuniculi DSM 21768 TaxID=1122245 RepID=A0A1N7DJ25_9GAMM|nr:hypothetical protein [Moraxella cuniculi]OOS08098.1 hypothetical protein B0189_01840 [Moraxella cuniculi]SIR75853.1 hypothetical protein SAMN02745664_101307 [Moraxella cuniculi DSM 21768]